MNEADRIEPRRLRRVLLVAGMAVLALAAAPAVAQVDATEDVGTTATASPSDPKPLEYPRWKTNVPGDHSGYNRRANLIQRGREVYDLYCVGCHGVNGDGNGPATARLITKPRDFRSGIYKFRSTDSGSLPLETDLYRTITRGLAQVSMPAFPLMPDRDKIAVVEYIKGFYPSWEEEKGRRKIVPVPRAPIDLDESERILRGRFVYLEMQCSQCHGIDGRGTGATQTEYTDAWGNKQKPFDFTRGSLKGGNAPEDVYRTFHTGLQSVMPAFNLDTLSLASRAGFESRRDSLSSADVENLAAVSDQFPATPDDAFSLGDAERHELGQRNSWDLVGYILSLRNPTTTAEAVLGPEHVAKR